MWCRHDTAGRPAFVFINASIDPADDVVLKARNLTALYHTLNLQDDRHALAFAAIDGAYRSARLPTLLPWSALLVQAVKTEQL